MTKYVLAFFILILNSCSNFKKTDISSLEPFHSAITNTHTFTRPAFLVKEGYEFTIFYTKPKYQTAISIPIGTKVQLISVQYLLSQYPAPMIPLPFSSQSIAVKCKLYLNGEQHIAYFQWLNGIAETMPQVHLNIRGKSTFLRQAPWEPNTVPYLRKFDLVE